ncbi:MAG: hypothetical protein IK072_05180 [Clostridia bacterium]|nr:hypothetical protein [Clostridia bacterium]
MEVYGTKPKLFTKEWWEYFWDYYKWHTILGVLLMIVLIASITECASRINYDLQIDYISEHKISDSSVAALTGLIEKNIDDINENGKNQAYVTVLDMGENLDPQYTQAMFTKYSVESGYTESFVFLVSKEYADRLSNEDVFEKAENWTSAPSYNGYCISLENCDVLKEIGIDTDDLYVGVIKLREREKKSEREKKLPYQKNGIKFAKFLVSKR